MDISLAKCVVWIWILVWLEEVFCIFPMYWLVRKLINCFICALNMASLSTSYWKLFGLLFHHLATCLCWKLF